MSIIEDYVKRAIGSVLDTVRIGQDSGTHKVYIGIPSNDCSSNNPEEFLVRSDFTERLEEFAPMVGKYLVPPNPVDPDTLAKVCGNCDRWKLLSIPDADVHFCNKSWPELRYTEATDECTCGAFCWNLDVLYGVEPIDLIEQSRLVDPDGASGRTIQIKTCSSCAYFQKDLIGDGAELVTLCTMQCRRVLPNDFCSNHLSMGG